MNIKITYNWLLEYLETSATPEQLQKYLSLCGPSIERIEKTEDDYVFDIEVTSNRVDMASVFGVAQEAQAILPQFKIPAKLKQQPFADYKLPSVPPPGWFGLEVKLTDSSLCSRFTAVVLKDINITDSPSFIKKRLNMCDVKSINNVIDISNYLMLSLGQPTHVFDYDKIKGHKMVMRLSKKGERIVTLDKKTIALPGGDIVIEDGSGAIIDLCGIMGGLNSSVTEDTKNIILFVQTYDKDRIRKTSMTTGIRTIAATYFEKGLNEEQVGPTAAYGLELLKKYAGNPIVSNIIDIYPNPYSGKTILVNFADITRLMGSLLPKPVIQTILTSLGFGIRISNDQLYITVPPSRKDDMAIKEDVVEEVSRIYGYFNLPNNLQPLVYLRQPEEIERLFEAQKKVKLFLKHLGLNEVMNYSMISEQMIINSDLRLTDHLKLKNTISEEIAYMRMHLTASLLKNIKDNEGKREVLHFFELAKTYKKQSKGLPEERYKLGLITNSSFSDLKGIVSALFVELNIVGYEIQNDVDNLFTKSVQGKVMVSGKVVGRFGELARDYQEKNKLRSKVYLGVFDFESLITNFRSIPRYTPINPHSQVKLDLTVKHVLIPSYHTFQTRAFTAAPSLTKIEFIGLFEDKINLRFYFQSKHENLTEKKALQELEKIKKSL